MSARHQTRSAGCGGGLLQAGGGDIHCRAFQDMDREEDRIARKGGEVGQAVAVSR